MFSILMPGLNRLINYRYSHLSGDIVSGIIVAVLFIPQSMAYAMIAGVPIVVGLYAATLPLIVYALFGSSKYLSVGPVSIVSILSFSVISNIAQPNSSYFLELTITLGLMVGCIHIFVGLVKTGYLFDYISPAVISGFISAAAIIIALNQLESLLGISLPHYQDFLNYFITVLNKLPQTNIYTLAIGLVCILLLGFFKKGTSLGPLFVVIFSILLVGVFDLQNKGVDIVGEIPKGLPVVTSHIPTLQTVKLLLPAALIIAFISFLESYAVVKDLANKENEHINTNQELIGLGLANITSSFVGSLPVAGAISRTAVNYHSGAKSNLSLIITASFIMFSLLYLTPLFYNLPKATLAAIIIMAVSNLINIDQFCFYIKTKPDDALVFITTFLATLMLDIFSGLLIGVGLSILIFLTRKKLSFTVYRKNK